MAEGLTVNVVSPLRQYTFVGVNSITLRTTEGEIQILPGHDALLAALDMGPLRIDAEKGGNHEEFFVNSGFVEVDRETVRVLAEMLERRDEIDLERAQKAMERAQKRIDSKEMNLDLPRAQKALRRAEYRIMVAKGQDTRQH